VTRPDYDRLSAEGKLVDFALWQGGMMTCYLGEIEKLKARQEVYRKALLALNALLADTGLPRYGAI
jgi:hypothetical protein